MTPRAAGRLLVTVLACSLLMASACSQFQSNSASASADAEAPPKTMDNYYDFDDIPVPQEMELQGDESF
ncbi:MAG: hypothetical protein ACOCWR_09685, partial [Oceanidesulfovibrio sp.]